MNLTELLLFRKVRFLSHFSGYLHEVLTSLAGTLSLSLHPSMCLICCSRFVLAVGTNLVGTATQAAAGGSSREASDRIEFGEAQEYFLNYYNTGILTENTNMGGQRDRGMLKHSGQGFHSL